MSQDRRRGCTSRVSSRKRRVLRSRFSYIYNNGDAFVEAASSVKTRVSYTSFDRRLLFVPASPMYSYQRSRGLVIPVFHNFVERRRCLTARVSYRLSSRTGHSFPVHVCAPSLAIAGRSAAYTRASRTGWELRSRCRPAGVATTGRPSTNQQPHPRPAARHGHASPAGRWRAVIRIIVHHRRACTTPRLLAIRPAPPPRAHYSVASPRVAEPPATRTYASPGQW